MTELTRSVLAPGCICRMGMEGYRSPSVGGGVGRCQVSIWKSAPKLSWNRILPLAVPRRDGKVRPGAVHSEMKTLNLSSWGRERLQVPHAWDLGCAYNYLGLHCCGKLLHVFFCMFISPCSRYLFYSHSSLHLFNSI